MEIQELIPNFFRARTIIFIIFKVQQHVYLGEYKEKTNYTDLQKEKLSNQTELCNIEKQIKCNKKGTVHCKLYLFLRRGSKFFCFPSCQGSRHVQGLHHFIVPEALILLKLGHKIIRKCYNGFYSVSHLTITQVLE